MCNKVKIFEKEGIRFLLSLPVVKHRNHIKTELLKHIKIIEKVKKGKEVKLEASKIVRGNSFLKIY